MPDISEVGRWMLRQPVLFDVLADTVSDINALMGPKYSVSYRQRWWSRRLYVCGYVLPEEAFRCADAMARLGTYRRIRIEVSFQESEQS